MDFLKVAAQLGGVGILLVLIAWYFRSENTKLAAKLEVEQNAKLSIVQTEAKAKMDMMQVEFNSRAAMLQLQNDNCQKDRDILHAENVTMRDKMDKMKDQIIDIYRSRNARNIIAEAAKLDSSVANEFAKKETEKVQTYPPS